MLPLFVLAGALTVILGVVAVAGVIGGVVLFCVQRLRFLAPWMLFFPTFAALGAGGGAWGLGYLAMKKGASMSVLPFWAWIGGLLEAARAEGIAFGAVTWGYTNPEALRALATEEVFASPEEILRKMG